MTAAGEESCEQAGGLSRLGRVVEDRRDEQEISNLRSGDFGQFLVAQRRALRWSQEELAERSTLSVRTIRNLETGSVRNPRRSSIDLLNAVLEPGEATSDFPMDSASPSEIREEDEWWRAGSGPSPQRLRWWDATPQPPPLVGRGSETTRVCETLQSSRCVLLTGPCGVGKTSLALAAAERMHPALRDGVVFVSMDELPHDAGRVERDLWQVNQAVRDAVGDSVAGSGNGPAAVDRRPGMHRLLILDNAEHVLEAVFRVAQQILSRSTDVRLIITSRRSMPWPSAQSWEVTPLGGEDSTGVSAHAVELLLRCTRSLCPTLDLTGQLPAVGELCARLDNVPFAIELAAARLRSVSLDTLLRDEPVRHVVRQVSRVGLPHQRTLARSVWWSYDLLAPEQQDLLHRLASFQAGFTMEDIEQTLGADGSRRSAVVCSLSGLVDASLLQVDRAANSYVYRMLGFVREVIRTSPSPGPG